ncbi:hypothetical protein [Sebaldella sp. S0638]|uniref:hypothetical protein n=1 Tax=Sebaldella sp. S0638 TaxID=2957809 RepID=UPI00209DD531|nr:hypothetical protein [Sebaldella sp. S0638]MCP1225380.1 hypothetical protein [Sebaldella sp. S0638]
MVDSREFQNKVIDFLVKLRNENTFDDRMYNEIYCILKELTEIWKKQDCIPKSFFLSCIYLTDSLAGGSRFLSEQDCEKIEDACNAIQELFVALEE